MNELLKYIRLYDLLKQRIENGEYKNGQKLPTEYQLTQDFDLSRQTVRQSLKMLESDGYIERIQGSGSYVRYENIVPRQNMTIAVITTYISAVSYTHLIGNQPCTSLWCPCSYGNTGCTQTYGMVTQTRSTQSSS